MTSFSDSASAQAIPKKRNPRHSYDENLDEPGKLIESEPVDVQTGTPDEGNVPVERVREEDKPGPPVFEEDDNGNR